MPDIVDLLVEDDRWSSIDFSAIAERAVAMALSAAECHAAGYEVSVLACDDARIGTLNAEFRDRSGPTNILSWPAFELAALADGGRPDLPPAPKGIWAETLGDMAISYDTCQREADEMGIDLTDHATHLIIHGCLHLLGYDHEREGDAGLMAGLESKALASLGMADPYSGHGQRY